MKPRRASAKRRPIPPIASGPWGRVDLSDYTTGDYQPGRSYPIRALWHLLNTFLIRNDALPFSPLRAMLLRAFGAKIGVGVVLQHGINVKYPWNLEIGDHSWIGEDVWLDSLGKISIGSHVVLSQGALLLTGNHDWSDPFFRLQVGDIRIEDGSWIGAKATVCPGVCVGTQAVLSAGSIATRDLEANQVHSGNPAVPVKTRRVRA